MIFLKNLLTKFNQKKFIKKYNLDEETASLDEELGKDTFVKLLRNATKYKSEQQVSNASLLIATGTLELLRHCVLNKNLTSTMAWLAQDKEIDEEIKTTVFSYLWTMKAQLGGEVMPINRKLDE